MYTSVEEILDKYNIIIENEYYDIILDIFNGRNDNLYLKDSEILNLLAVYYMYEIKDKEISKEYYLLAIDFGNIHAMNNLGYYYYLIKDYENMKIYYLMAIELGNFNSLKNLLTYFCEIEDYNNLEKYFSLVNLNILQSKHTDFIYSVINFLANLYYLIEDYEKMEKYYLMGIELGDTKAMNNLGYYYSQNGEYELMEKYLLMAINLGCSMALLNIIEIFNFIKNIEKFDEYIIIAIKTNNTDVIKKYLKDNLALYLEHCENIDLDILKLFSKKNQNLSKFLKTKHPLTKEILKMFDYKHNYNNLNTSIFSKLYEKYVKYNKEITSGYITDFKFIINDTIYYIHSLVLNSDYFEKLFGENFKSTNELELDCSDTTIKEFIKFLYLGKISQNLDIETLDELYNIGDYFNFDNLKILSNIN